MVLQRLRDLREDNDFLQKGIAQILNISTPTYSGYETGSKNIPYQSLIVLAQFYHTSADYILGLTNETTPYPRKKQ